ncbi:type VI secretion system-associated protein TagF [Roseibium sp.]|uniref:type VI secretion system-associated protein TagF n=1 Tax=Roseibium sp. TaxID=1936156 RepID=UPI003D0F74F0
MHICGFFGKRPAERDFVFEGLPARVTDAWANMMSGWLGACTAAAPKTWQNDYFSAPVWRFALPVKHLDDHSWIGLVAASADTMGRTFPLAVLMSMHVDRFGKDVIFQIDEIMDRLELELLTFLAGESNRRHFLNSVTNCSADIRAAIDEAPYNVSMTLPDLENDEAGLCIPWTDLVAPNEVAAHILVWPEAGKKKRPLAPGYWWHEGSPERVSEVCVFSAMPGAEAARGIYLGQWEAQGWRERG